jgi:hypothetical protein
LDGLFVSLDGPFDRDLGCPTQFLEEPADMVFVVMDTELLGNDPGDASAGPDLT